MKPTAILLTSSALVSLAAPAAGQTVTPRAGVAAAATSPTVSDAAPGAEPDAADIVVTGTRRAGVRTADSAAPVQVIDAEALSRVGRPNLNQVLIQLAPSFAAQAFGGDASNLTLTAKLRGLSATTC